MVVSKSSGLLKNPAFLNHFRNAIVDSKGNPRKFLTIHDVDFVVNPNEAMIDKFMEGYGKLRLNFKRNDISIWRDSFGIRYNTTFVCLKDSGRIINTSHFIDYPAISPDIDVPHQYQGFFWIDPDFRGYDSMLLTDYYAKHRMRNLTDNAVAQCMPVTLNLWAKNYGHKEVGHTQYVTYYEPSEMRVPGELTFDGITVKSAKEVPDEDITEYDQSIFPYERSKYMLTHLRDPAGFGKVAYDDNGNVIGLGTVVIYPSGECVLTPLYADAPSVAQAIFKSILQEIPLNDKKLLRFQIRSIDKNMDGFEWIQPFVKSPIRRELMGYLCYVTHLPIINYRKVFANVPYTTSAI